MKKLSLFSNRSSKGKAAEEVACTHLKKNGLSLIEKNFHSRFGEIDLIMQHQDTLVFIEVRYRKNTDFGGAKASITPHNNKKFRKLLYTICKKKGASLMPVLMWLPLPVMISTKTVH